MCTSLVAAYDRNGRDTAMAAYVHTGQLTVRCGDVDERDRRDEVHRASVAT